MKKITKKCLAFIVAFALVIGVLPMSVLAADYSGKCSENVTWSLNTDTGVLTISGSGDMGDYDWDNSAPWHSLDSYIKSVNIENGVTSIGDDAFSSCISLTSVTIGNSVTSIGDYAFYDCSSLTSVTIPNSVTSIGYGAFYMCSSLTSVTIPNSVTSIGISAFYMCSSLTSVTIPNSVTSIGDLAFYWCSSLTSVTIPNSVTSIGDGAFEYCSSLASVTIPNSVTSIGDWAFCECSSLTSVTIPNSVTSIGITAFYKCSSLTDVYYLGTEEQWNSIAIGYNNDPLKNATIYYVTDASCFEYTISNGEVTITKYVGSDTAVVIPSTIEGYPITSIGDRAFYVCNSLTTVTIPNSVTSIGDYAFGWCSSLTSVTIPNSVTSIGEGAFYMCSSLTSVTIPNSVTSIGASAFYDCSSLTDVYYSGTEAQWNSITIGDYNDPLNNATIHYATENSCDNFEYEISNSEVTITKYIGSDTAVVIPSTIEGYPVTAIGYSAFSGCSNLTSVTIPNSVTSIGGYAFYDCSSLTSVTIPNSVTSIGYTAFLKCSSLTDVYYSGTEAQWNSIAIGYNNDPLNNATIHYVDFVYGDANGDGRINNKDLGLLMQKLNGWDVEISDAVVDVNADGRVNNKDYGLLMQYVNGWNVEIG